MLDGFAFAWFAGAAPAISDPLGTEPVANLMQHAFVLAAVQCHVFLGYPLPPEAKWTATFGRERFEALARGEPSRRNQPSVGPT